jgi:drug/metabolite transporter (DMT)-like permease
MPVEFEKKTREVNMLKGSERSGLGLALLGFMLLTCGDAVVKTMAGQWPPTAVAALRYSFGLIGLVVVLMLREGPRALVIPHPKVQLLRGLGIAMATICFFAALFVMPLTAATAITFTSPMITAVLAAVVLREPAGRGAWLAIGLAFVGVLIVLRPNVAAVGVAALLPLATALGFSVLLIGNRLLAGAGSALAMQFTLALCAAPMLVLAAIAGHFSGIAPLQVGLPSIAVVLKCMGVAATATTAHWLIFIGISRAGAGRVAPMTYVQLLMAAAIGLLYFGHWPDMMTMLGAGVIVVAGLILLHAGPAIQQRSGVLRGGQEN